MSYNDHRPTDEELDLLIEGCRKQDVKAQEQFYKSCYMRFMPVCLRYTDDMDGAAIVFNNALLRIFRNLDTYKNEGKLMAWVKAIVVNCCLDHIKQTQKLKFQPIPEMVENELTAATSFPTDITAKEIREWIQSLPKTTATVFNLFIYEGFSHKEIASILDIAEGTSKWHVNEGRRILQQKITTIKKG